MEVSILSSFSLNLLSNLTLNFRIICCSLSPNFSEDKNLPFLVQKTRKLFYSSSKVSDTLILRIYVSEDKPSRLSEITKTTDKRCFCTCLRIIKWPFCFKLLSCFVALNDTNRQTIDDLQGFLHRKVRSTRYSIKIMFKFARSKSEKVAHIFN